MILAWLHCRKYAPNLAPSAQPLLPEDQHRIILWDTDEPFVDAARVMHPIEPEM